MNGMADVLATGLAGVVVIAIGWWLLKKAAASLIRAVDWMTRHEK